MHDFAVRSSITKKGVEGPIRSGLQLLAHRIGPLSGETPINQRVQHTLASILEQPETWHQDISANPELTGVEPALVSFIAEALEYSVNSPNATKRRLFGDLIVERMGRASESVESINVLHGLRIAAQATERQLILLAATWIRRHDTIIFGVSEEQIERSLRDVYLNVIMHPLCPGFVDLDIKHMQALGALQNGSEPLTGGTASKSAIAEWLIARGLLYVEDYPRFNNTSYPTLDFWAQLLQPPNSVERTLGRCEYIGDLQPTPAGTAVGEVLVRRLRKTETVIAA